MQLTIFISTILSIIGFAAATPPACIISAIGVQGSDATDMEVLCNDKQEYVLGNMTTACSTDHLSDAYDYYSSTCLDEAQVTVADLPTSTTSTSGSSGSSSDSSTTGSSASVSSTTESDSVDSAEKESAATTAAGASMVFMHASFAIAAFFAGGMTVL